MITVRAVFVFLAVLTSLVAYSAVARADSPPNITTDIPWSAAKNGVNDVEEAFNHARRQEEIQLGLSSGKLGNLDLPAQALWDTYSDDQKATVILNAERVARNGMIPGVIGLPFTAIQVDVDNVAQGHANYLLSANKTGHIDGAGKGPSYRLENDPALKECTEFLSRAENIAYFWTSGSSNPLYIERSIYNWIYDDASSNWGHREAALIQDKDLAYQSLSNGFSNNVGSALDEGFIGIGVAESATYWPPGYEGWNWGTIVVLNMIDPIPEDTCPWDKEVACYPLTLDHEGTGSDLEATPGKSAGCEAGEYTADQEIVLSATPDTGWAVSHWAGTDDDSSTSKKNSLTMPACDHTVGIEYVPVLVEVFEYIYLPLIP